MDRSGDGAIAPSSWLDVSPRFALVSTSERDYTFASLTRSIQISAQNGRTGLMSGILERLQNGCTMQSLLEGVDPADQQLAEAAIQDLVERDVVRVREAQPSDGSDSAERRAQIAFFSNFTAPGADDGPNFQGLLEDARIFVAGLGDIADRLIETLIQLGVGTIVGPVEGLRASPADVRYETYQHDWAGSASGEAALPERISLVVLCEERYSPNRYATMNRLCLELGLPWISYRYLGLHYEIGPAIFPRETACYTCFSSRRAANHESYEQYVAMQNSLYAAGLSTGSLNIAFGADVLALEVLKLVTHFSRPITYGAYFSFDILSLQGKVHPVLKVPRCIDCSPASRRPGVVLWRPTEMGASVGR